ncbi:hypothetical protein EV424DRAFT_1539000 [Suillus variegatus]|nr:hypothetical protein EV424DRAFT_1539000 [Suillus variegatus]
MQDQTLPRFNIRAVSDGSWTRLDSSELVRTDKVRKMMLTINTPIGSPAQSSPAQSSPAQSPPTQSIIADFRVLFWSYTLETWIKGLDASKDASEIVWFHDADDSMPISPHPESSSKALPSDGGPSHRTLDNFLGQNRMPAAFIAGSHRSGRPTKPSAKVREAASSAIPAKRLGTATMPPATKRPAPSTIGDDASEVALFAE